MPRSLDFQKFNLLLGSVKQGVKIDFIAYNTFRESNDELFNEYCMKFDIQKEKQKLPILFINNHYLCGESEIEKKLKESFVQEINNIISEIKYFNVASCVECDKVTAYIDTLDMSLNGYHAAGVFFTALLNGFNPCSISMLLFFISLITVKQYNILKLGISYIFGKILAYSALGTILFDVLIKAHSLINPIENIFKVFLIIAAIILMFVSFADYISAKHEKYGRIRLQLPVKLRKLNHAEF